MYLFLWEVGNMTGHGSGDDEAASLSLSEVQTNGSGTVVDTGQIGLDNLIPLLDWGIEDTAICRSAGVGDEDIDLAEILDHLRNELLHLFVAPDIALVGLGLDAVFLRELFGVFLSTSRARGVGDGDVGAHLSASSCGFGANASGTGSTGDNDDLALQAEEVVEGGGGRDGDRHDGRGVENPMGAGYQRWDQLSPSEDPPRIEGDGNGRRSVVEDNDGEERRNLEQRKEQKVNIWLSGRVDLACV